MERAGSVLRGSRVLRLVLALGFLIASCCLLAAANTAPIPDDSTLIAAAKKDGTLTLYGALTAVQLRAIAQRFETAYGVTVQVLRIESTSIPSRILTEERAGRDDADVVSDSGFEIDLLKRQGVLAQYRPPEDRDLLAGTFDPSGYWSSTLINTETIVYNPVQVQAAGLRPPRSWDDLAQKAWRGHLGLFAGSYQWYGALRRAYGASRADDLMAKIAANQPRMFGSKQVGMGLIESGEILAAPNLYGYDALNEKRKGQPIDFVNPAPTIIEPYVAAILKQAPHPNAARLFVRWWLSHGTQQWQREELGRVSARRDVTNDPSLMNARVKYEVSNPAESPHYGEFVKAFNRIFDIPG